LHRIYFYAPRTLKAHAKFKYEEVTAIRWRENNIYNPSALTEQRKTEAAYNATADA
jgi:hypothetical protein